MRHTILSVKLFAIFSLSAIFFSSCSSPSILKVQYQLPVQSAELSGQEILFSFQDERSNDALLSPNARKSLKNFSGNFSLTVVQAEGQKALVGAYELSNLLKEIFIRRLQNVGIKVAEGPLQAEPEIEIVLEEFWLDLKDRKWIFRMAYRANLKKNQKLLSAQTISGSAERFKVVGSADAEKVIAELVTDMVNRLNLEELFRQAGL